jgi:hypothetical protein
MKRVSEVQRLWLKRISYWRWQRSLSARTRAAERRNRKLYLKKKSARFEIDFTTRQNLRRPQSAPGPFLNREHIVLPNTFSLRTNRKDTLSVIEQIRTAVFTSGYQAYLYFDNVEEIEVGATMLLAAEVFRCNSLRRRGAVDPVIGNYPTSIKVFAQLKEMGFFRLLKVAEPIKVPENTLDSNRPIFLQFNMSARVESEFAANFVDVVTKDIFAMEPRSKGQMVAALKEAMSNSNEHAYAEETEIPALKKRWWMAGHLDFDNHEMMVMLLDLGIGIPNSLKPDLFEVLCAIFWDRRWVPRDSDMIAAATEVYRTSTGRGGRGRGFRDMKRFVDSCDDGELRVLSNRGSYTYAKGMELTAEHDDSIGGTLIEWRVKHGAVAAITQQ